MADERQVDEAELLDVAHDPEQARRLHRALRAISASPSLDGPLRDMARQVLRGDLGMREAVTTDTYTEAIYGRLREMRTAAENQTHAERQAAGEQFAHWEEKQAADEAREQTERDAPTHLHTDPGRGATGGPGEPGGRSHRA